MTVWVFIFISINVLNDLIHVFLLKEALNLFLFDIENTNKKTIIWVIYRPPDINTLDNFFEDNQCILHNITSENKTSYIMGDLNINLLSNTDSSINFDNIFIYTYMQLHSGTIS